MDIHNKAIMETNQYLTTLTKRSEWWQAFSVDPNPISLTAFNQVFASGQENECLVEMIACNSATPYHLLLCAKSIHASSLALTEIASHQRNVVCWEAIAKHPNVTAFHLELIMSYDHGLFWFETESAIAGSKGISEEVIEKLLKKNMVPTGHHYHNEPNRMLSKRQHILRRLLNNPFLQTFAFTGESYREQCAVVLNDTSHSIRMTG